MIATPDISIIIPAYNVAPYIGQCLESILRQDGASDFEIIVVNDGSTDNTAKIVHDYSYTNRNIKLITQKNRGVSVARNNAMSQARGYFVSFVDADDMVGLSYEKMLPYFVNPNEPSLRFRHDKTRDNMRISFLYFQPSVNMDGITLQFDTQYFTRLIKPLRIPGMDISFGGKITIDGASRGLLRSVYESDELYMNSPADKQKILHHADIRESANFALYRRKFLERYNLRFLPQMDLDEDMLFTQQAALRAHIVATVSDATYLYNRRAGTLSNMTMSELGRQHKFDLARVQRYSMILDELRRHPEYAAVYSAIVQEFADPEYKIYFYRDCVPPKICATCKKSTCNGCAQHKTNTALIRRNISDFITNMR